MGILFRVVILVAIIILAYSALKYLLHPKRKLEQAHDRNEYYFYDDGQNVRKNFLITYKGVMFEGKKQLGTTENAFDIVSVSVWARNSDQLAGLSKEDFHFIEEDIRTHYPHATIQWQGPIQRLLQS